MPSVSNLNLEKFAGRSHDRLTLDERAALVGYYMARQVYSPKNLALQRIETVGESVGACVENLKRAGKNPLDYEFTRFNPAY
jgi:hypothetical protein